MPADSAKRQCQIGEAEYAAGTPPRTGTVQFRFSVRTDSGLRGRGDSLDGNTSNGLGALAVARRQILAAHGSLRSRFPAVTVRSRGSRSHWSFRPAHRSPFVLEASRSARSLAPLGQGSPRRQVTASRAVGEGDRRMPWRPPVPGAPRSFSPPGVMRPGMIRSNTLERGLEGWR